MSLGGGDQLARGAHRAQFQSADVPGEEPRKLNVMSDEERERLDKEEKELLAKTKEATEAPKASVPKVPFRAVQDRVVVARLEEEEKVGSFFVPDESKEKPAEGLVIAVGPGKYVYGNFVPTTVQPGERILFGKYSGQEVKVGFQTFLILREEDIFIVKDPQ